MRPMEWVVDPAVLSAGVTSTVHCASRGPREAVAKRIPDAQTAIHEVGRPPAPR